MKAMFYYYLVQFINKKKSVIYMVHQPLKVGSSYGGCKKGSFKVLGFIASCNDDDIVEKGDLFDTHGSFI